MLDYILNTAQAFEREHGIAPDIIYSNPVHYEHLARYSPELFAPGNKLDLGFRLVIVPANVLAHPQASLLSARYDWSASDGKPEPGGQDMSGRCRDADVAGL
jgi:hypothetical protein